MAIIDVIKFAGGGEEIVHLYTSTRQKILTLGRN